MIDIEMVEQFNKFEEEVRKLKANAALLTARLDNIAAMVVVISKCLGENESINFEEKENENNGDNI